MPLPTGATPAVPPLLFTPSTTVFTKTVAAGVEIVVLLRGSQRCSAWLVRRLFGCRKGAILKCSHPECHLSNGTETNPKLLEIKS